jgi:hypothetical protein
MSSWKHERWKCTLCHFIYDPAEGDPEHGVKAVFPSGSCRLTGNAPDASVTGIFSDRLPKTIQCPFESWKNHGILLVKVVRPGQLNPRMKPTDWSKEGGMTVAEK